MEQYQRYVSLSENVLSHVKLSNIRLFSSLNKSILPEKWFAPKEITFVWLESAQFFASYTFLSYSLSLFLSLFLPITLSILLSCFLLRISHLHGILPLLSRTEDTTSRVNHDFDRSTIFCRWQTSPASRYASEEVHEEAGHTVQLGHGQVPLPQLQQRLQQTGHHARPL